MSGRTAPELLSPILERLPSFQSDSALPATVPRPAEPRDWLSLPLTKSTLAELQGITLNKTVNGNTWSVSYDCDQDVLIVIDKSRSLRYPAIFGDDNRVRVDINNAIPFASPGLHLSVLGEVLRADASGAELLNGRAAMVGIVAGLAGEYQNQEVLARQLFSQDGASLAVIAGVAVLAASIAPAIVGRLPVQKTFPAPEYPYPTTEVPNVWTYEAELLNGRLAMIGFFGLMMAEVMAGRSCGLVTKALTNWSC